MIGVALFAFAAFSSLFVDLIGLDSTGQQKYNITVGDEFRSTYANISLLTNALDNATGLVYNISSSSDNATFIENDYTDPSKTQIKPVKLAKASFTIFKSMIFKSADVLNIPPILIYLVIFFLIVALTLAFIGLIFRFKP
jgi:hypothetical protein